MKTLTNLSFAILALIMLAVSCKKEEIKNPGGNGNKPFEYSYVVGDSVVYDLTVSGQTFKNAIVSVVTENKGDGYFITVSYIDVPGYSAADTSIAYEDENGIYYVDKDGNRQLGFPANPKEGDTIQFKIEANEITRIIKKLNVTKQVKSGTFICVRYDDITKTQQGIQYGEHYMSLNKYLFVKGEITTPQNNVIVFELSYKNFENRMSLTGGGMPNLTALIQNI